LIATLLSAVATCVASLALGQAALRLAGAREWSWLAPPVGISVAMLISATALFLPGGCTTVSIVLGLLTVAAIVWCGMDPAQRPPLSGLLAAAPVAALLFVPFLAVGHFGTLGVAFDNDMATHLWVVERYLIGSSVPEAAPPGYPIASHGMVAVIARGLHLRADYAFAGWTMALPILSAWTALALVRRASWLGKALTATVVGLPFLVAAYYGEGAFKEVLQAGLVLASAVFFIGCEPKLGRGRWVPLALILGGIISAYSTPGLAWPIVFGALWLVVTTTLWIRRNGTGGLREAVTRELPPLGIGLAVFIIVILPQASRIWTFAQKSGGAGLVGKEELGNLFGPLPGWEGFGVWSRADFRVPPSHAFGAEAWSAFVVVLVFFGGIWLLRRGRWMLPLAAAGAMLVWAVTGHSQSLYVAAKALIIASPLLLAVAVVPLAEQLPERPWRALSSAFRFVPGPPRAWGWGLAAILAAVLFVRVGVSDVEALRISPVGPTAHTDELRELRPLVHDQPTLFLGNDDYAHWELAGVPVHGPVIALPELPLRPEKHWEYGQAFDFDSVSVATLNEYPWVITTRDAAGSSPPPQMHAVKETPNFILLHRVGKVLPRSILNEGELAGAVLNCKSPRGRRVLEGGGVAAVRPPQVRVPGVFYMGPGGTAEVEIDLPPGRWELDSSYVGRLPMTVTAPGLHTTVPASLDRPGPRWPLGQVTVGYKGPTRLTFTLSNPLLAPGIVLSEIYSIVATRDAKTRVIPMREACGEYVDWYRSAGSDR
jgi:hypothetical protein